MRRTRMMCRLTLAGGTLLLALTGCSGGSNNDAAATSSAATTSTSSAPATTSSAAPVAAGGDAFCDQARNFITEVQATTEDTSSPQRLQQTLPTLVDQLKSITPPPAIAADWQTALSALQQMAAALQGVNLSDPQSLQQLAQKVQPAEAQLGAAGQHIDDYLKAQCGITASSTG